MCYLVCPNDVTECALEIIQALCTKNDEDKVRVSLHKRVPVSSQATFTLPICTNSVLDKQGKYQISPPKVKLSDEHVYLVTKFLSTQQRKQKFHLGRRTPPAATQKTRPPTTNGLVDLLHSGTIYRGQNRIP